MSDSFYHVYSRGINKEDIFSEDKDKAYIEYLLSRHLSKNQVTNSAGYSYPHYASELELLSYCIMDNHVHFLFYQKEVGALKELMQSMFSAYTAYYNRKHSRRGPLFESRYKSSLVDKEDYLLHVSRYIHLNPRSWKRYAYSSYRAIVTSSEPEWLRSEKVLEQHASRKAYKEFVEDYVEHKKILDELKYQLANL